MLENIVDNTLFTAIALTLVHFLWQGVAVAFVLKAILISTPLKKAQLRYASSAFAMLLNFLLPIITFSIIYQTERLHLAEPLLHSTTSFFDINIVKENPDSFMSFLPYITTCWFAVVVILSIRLIWQMHKVNQLPKYQCAMHYPELEARFAHFVEQLGLKVIPKLVVSLKAEVPMAIGWLKPFVLLPASIISGLTPTQLDMLILHELAHIRRHDYLVNLLQSIVEILLFFHPAVFWVSKQMRIEREYCSDDIAVKYSGNALAYAHTLTDTASICNKHRHHAIPTMAMAISGGDLKQRVLRLVNKPHDCTKRLDSSKWMAAVLVVFGLLLTASNYLMQITLINSKQKFNDEETSLTAANINNLFSEYSSVIDFAEFKESFVEAIPDEIANSINLVANTPLYTPSIVPNSLDSSTENNIETSGKNIAENINKSIANQATTIVKQAEKPSAEVTVEKITLANNQLKNSSVDRVQTENKKVLVNNKVVDEGNKSSVISSVNTTQKTNDAIQSPSNINDTKIANINASKLAKVEFTNLDQLADNVQRLEKVKQENTVKPTSDINLLTSAQKVTASKIKQAEAEPNLVIEEQAPQIVDAKIIDIIEPKYPLNAKTKNIEIDILVNFTIDENGEVTDIEFEKKSKANYFRSSIRTAMKKWKFLPAQQNGMPVESNMTRIFSFNLNT